ncbi:MAG TPA: FliM/FliN family flagellar motor switch protein [Caulobacteraceae bacterium]
MAPGARAPVVGLAVINSQVDAVQVEISIVLGRSVVPMQQLLRMGRGAVITLDANANDEVWILANNHPVARGEIQINNDKITIAVTRAADVYDFMAGG